MGFMDKVKGLFVGYDEEYEEGDNVDIIAEQPAPQSKPTAYEYDEDEDVSKRKGNKVVKLRATTQLQVILVKPEQFEDASAIADHLNAKKTVVLNLESATKELSRRLIDFLSGVAYANSGQIKRVANSTFIITPYNVDIMGELIDELENNGVYF